MRISYQTIRRWLEVNASKCSLEQLRELDQLIQAGMQAAAEEEQKIQAALEAAREAAEKAGVSPELLLRRLAVNDVGHRAWSPTESTPPRTGVRKPFMNPFSDDGVLYANVVAHPNRKKPEWLIRAEREGISLAMCHYKRLDETWKLKGMPRLYDPLQRYAQLVAQEPVRYQRKSKGK